MHSMVIFVGSEIETGKKKLPGDTAHVIFLGETSKCSHWQLSAKCRQRDHSPTTKTLKIFKVKQNFCSKPQKLTKSFSRLCNWKIWWTKESKSTRNTSVTKKAEFPSCQTIVSCHVIVRKTTSEVFFSRSTISKTDLWKKQLSSLQLLREIKHTIPFFF